MNRACSFTLHKNNNLDSDVKDIKVSKFKLYKSEHSPIRTKIFWIELLSIPSFVSTHFVRHKVGIEHFVSTNRDDRGNTEVVTRDTLVNHAMLVNAQALINMARLRLCHKAHKETITVMQEIVNIMKDIDPILHCLLVPNCFYKKECTEFVSCGLWERTQKIGDTFYEKEKKCCTNHGCSGAPVCGMHKEM
jgi:hypothetical protein